MCLDLSRQKIKYNATEVRITRCVFSLFFFAALAGLVFLQFRLLRLQPYCVLSTAAVLTALAVWFGCRTRNEKKAGADFDHTIWSARFIFFWSCVAAATMLWLCATLPIDYWGYSIPVAYLLLGMVYILYVAAWDQNPSFRFFAVVAAVAAFFGILTYQTYYNRMQNLISTRILSQPTAFTVGWITLTAAAVLLLWFRYRGKTFAIGVWKSFGVILLFAAYWILLYLKVGTGFLLTVLLGAALFVWFIVLRILRGIGIIK